MTPDSRPRRLVFVVGTRAQLIKIAPVVVACEAMDLDCTLLMTGQHRDTMQDLVSEFRIRSAQVAVVEASERSTVRSLVRWLPRAVRRLQAELVRCSSDGVLIDVLVHGDTLSTLIGAFAARRVQARVVHLESGLTSGRLFDPFPEEICRRLVFRMTDIAMCPNQAAADLMRRRPKVLVVETHGNTIIDAVALSGAADCVATADRNYLLVSMHRFQNIYNARRLRSLAQLIEAAARHLPVRFILHPATRNRLEQAGLIESLSRVSNLSLLPRMGYGEFLRMAAGAACVLTDGGSNQEELAMLGVPTVIMRARTERPDGLGSNAVMEADLTQGVEAFLEAGAFAALRTPLAAPPDVGPSRRIANFLAAPAVQPSATGISTAR